MTEEQRDLRLVEQDLLQAEYFCQILHGLFGDEELVDRINNSASHTKFIVIECQRLLEREIGRWLRSLSDREGRGSNRTLSVDTVGDSDKVQAIRQEYAEIVKWTNKQLAHRDYKCRIGEQKLDDVKFDRLKSMLCELQAVWNEANRAVNDRTTAFSELIIADFWPEGIVEDIESIHSH